MKPAEIIEFAFIHGIPVSYRPNERLPWIKCDVFRGAGLGHYKIGKPGHTVEIRIEDDSRIPRPPKEQDKEG